MGIYEIEYQGGITIKTMVLDSAELIDKCIFNFSYQAKCDHVVGIDLKLSTSGFPGQLLILCVGSQCLVIQLQQLDRVPDSLKRFVVDETICFVGVKMQQISNYIERSPYSLKCKTGVECSELAARVLKKPGNLGKGLGDLARDLGLDSINQIHKNVGFAHVKWDAKVFSPKEIEYAIQDAYASYVIGKKLLGML